MKKNGVVLAIAFLVFSSFGMHKFYTAIYQIEFAPKKKMIQITTRIFIDDLNKALEKKYKKNMSMTNYCPLNSSTFNHF